MSSMEPDDGGGEVDCAKEVALCFVVSSSYSSVLFEFREEVFD